MDWSSMSESTKASFVVLGLLFAGFFSFVIATGCDESPPPKPAHYIHVNTSEIPAYEIADTKVRSKDFQLVTLEDGHDYWVYHLKKSERGYGGIAHSPECKRCRDQR